MKHASECKIKWSIIYFQAIHDKTRKYHAQDVLQPKYPTFILQAHTIKAQWHREKGLKGMRGLPNDNAFSV
jgi:hypothetical protein